MEQVDQKLIRRIVDRQAIEELIYRRALTLDRRDLNGQLNCYTEDATTLYAGWEGTAEDFLRFRSTTATATSKVSACLHFITNVIVFLDTDEDARAHSHHLCTYTRSTDDGSEEDGIVVGRYFDWVRKDDDGIWRIARRETVFDWSHAVPADSERYWAGSDPQHLLVGQPDRADPFYTRFEGRVAPWSR